MASADIEKLAVFDPRIVQTRPKFAVDKGALSVTNAPFQALSQTTSQHTYSVQVPSETTFVDRAVNWTSQLGIALTFSTTVAVNAASATTITFGNATTSEKSPWGYCAFPLQSLTSTIQATINDTNVVINTADVLKEVLRLVDIRANTLQRTTPTKLDTYASVLVDSGFANSTYGSYINAGLIQEEAPNSASWLSGSSKASAVCPYVDVNGNPLPNGTLSNIGTTQYSLTSVGSAVTFTGGSVAINADGSIVVSGITPSASTGSMNVTLVLYIAPWFTEKLVLSPFVFSDIHERETGLFGIQNIQFVMNMRNPQDCRLIRQREAAAVVSVANAGNATYTLTSAYANLSGLPSFQNSRLDVMFLTPSLDLPLPPKSVVPYMEFPRYITSNVGTISANSSAPFSTQTITLPQIPDYFVIYAKPSVYGSGSVTDSTQGDWYLPISNISLQWDNYAGLMSTMTQQQLYEIAVENGVSQDYQQWSGRLPAGWSVGEQANSASTTSIAQAVGGFLVIKPGKDYALSTGQAPSLVGNYTFQANITLNNYTANSVTPVIYVMTVNSGFFESVKGTSRVVKGILSEADIISAPLSSVATRSALTRAVGGKGLLSKLGHAIGKVASHIAPMAKMALPHLKPHLPTEIQQGLSHFGLGDGHPSPSHTGGEGDGRRHRKHISKRLL